MKLLHLADVHLGARYPGFGDIAPRRSQDVLAAFRRLPDVAADETVDAVLVAGDLFDGPQPPRTTMAAVRDTIRLLLDLPVPVFLVPGNHDGVTLRDDPYRELARGSGVVLRTGADDRPTRTNGPRAWILASPRFEDPVRVETRAGPLNVYGIGYDPAECDDPISTFRRTAGDGVHVALLHASVHAASHWEASASSLVVRPEALATVDVDYIALGDHHRPTLPGEIAGAPACYPGSFAATDLTEDGPRGFHLVSVAPGSTPQVEHRDAGVARVIAVEVETRPLPDEVRVAEAAAAELGESAVPVVRLVGEPSFPLDVDIVRAELVARYGAALVVDRTRYYASDRLDELEAEDTVAGHAVRLGRERIQGAGDDTDLRIARQALRTALRALGVE